MIIIVLLLICIGSQVESDSPNYPIHPISLGKIAQHANTWITHGNDDRLVCSLEEKESAKEDNKEKIEEPDEEITGSGSVPDILSTSHLSEHSKASMSTRKKEDVSPSVPKPCPGLRSSKNKKRKPNEVVDLGPGIEGMEWVLKGVAKLMEEWKIIHTEVQELRNANLDAYTKCAAIDKELQVAKKRIKEMDEMVENVKQIQMASQAVTKKSMKFW